MMQRSDQQSTHFTCILQSALLEPQECLRSSVAVCAGYEVSQVLGSGWEPQAWGVSGSNPKIAGISGVRVTDDDGFDTVSPAAPTAVATAPVRMTQDNLMPAGAPLLQLLYLVTAGSCLLLSLLQ